jgi:hypothetical protein
MQSLPQSNIAILLGPLDTRDALILPNALYHKNSSIANLLLIFLRLAGPALLRSPIPRVSKGH